MWFVGPGNPVRPAARFQPFLPSESITCRESLVPGVCYSEAGRSLRERPPLEVQVSPLCNRIFQPTPRPSAAGSEKVKPLASSPLHADPPLARWPGLCLAKPSQFRPCRLPAPRPRTHPPKRTQIRLRRQLLVSLKSATCSHLLALGQIRRTNPIPPIPPLATRRLLILAEQTQFQPFPGPWSRCGCVLPNEPNVPPIVRRCIAVQTGPIPQTGE